LPGAVSTRPQAGPALPARIIASAADKQLVLSDFDDTLAGYNEVLPADKIEAVRQIRAAGKHFAVISDRGDVKRPNSTQLTVFESLESLPVSVRAGMFVAANSGGKVYRYDDQGVPQKVHEAEALEAGKLELVQAAAAATKARLSEVGAAQHAGDDKNPSESYNTYGYAMMLKPGSSEGAVRGAAAILTEELSRRGIEVEVNPRFAKDPANPPYVTFSIITKADAAAYIAKALGVAAKDALVIGDAMFVPRDAKKAGWLSRLGERLSGRPQAKTGNETDRNMAKNLPGVLALGVGAAMDPRVPNGWALDGKGPAVTQKVLEAVAAKQARPGDGGKAALKALEAKYAAELGTIPGVVAVKAEDTDSYDGVNRNETAGKRLSVIFADVPSMQAALPSLPATLPAIAGVKGVARYNVKAEVEKSALHEAYRALEAKHAAALSNIPGVVSVKFEDTDFYEGVNRNDTAGKRISVIFANEFSMKAALPSMPETLPAIAGVKDVARYNVVAAVSVKNGGSRGEAAIQLGMIAAIVGMGAVGWYAFATALGDIVRMGEEAVRNWQSSPFGQDAGFFLGATTLGVAGMMGPSAIAKAAPAGLTHAVEPNALYALALEKITAKAAAAGVPIGRITFLSAVHESRSFNGVWVGDEWRFHFGWGGANGGVEYVVPARRTTISETMMDAFEPELKGMVSAARLAEGMGAAYFDLSVKLGPDAALKSVDGVTRVSLLPRVGPPNRGRERDLWYSYQDARREISSMNARTGEIRKAAPAAPKGSALKSFLLWLGGVSLVVAIYGGFYWAASHAPVAVPQGIPEGWQGPIPTIDDVFRGMGGVLGLGMLAGALKRGPAKPKVTNDEIAAAAKSVAASKGGIWSSTEYNMSYSMALDSLKSRGATKAQLELFKKLCDEAPVIGGRFNPWSGD
ncbi:MAG: hypothetical protein PHS14_17225, partial [Elusimicrobia bacterium]|nr:hypothetical protein [Elusimicrobiota bacterium]